MKWPRASLQTMVILPVFLAMLAAGAALYFLVLRTVSDYASASISANVSSLIAGVRTIADAEVDRQNSEGHASDANAALDYQLNARLHFEDFARGHGIGIVILADDVPDFVTGLPHADAAAIQALLPIKEISRIELPSGKGYYAGEARFTPWDWQFVVASDARNFDVLIGEVQKIYLGTAIGIALIAALLFYWLRRELVRPIYAIAHAFSEGRAPHYRGVKELEHLSTSIGDMFEDLGAKTMHLATTLESMSDGIAVFDSDLRLVFWNSHYVRLYRYPEDLVRPGMKFADIIRYNIDRGDYGPSNPGERLQEIVERARTLQPPRFEIDRADGTSMEVRRAPMPDGGFVTTYTDITDRRQRSRFEAANEAKSQFLQNISHDLRKPITAIIEDARLAETIELAEMAPERRRPFANIGANASYLLDMIDGLLEMSRIEAGQIEVHLQDVDVQPVMAQVMRLIEPSARTRGLSTDMKVESGLSVIADPRLLHRILVNLVGNAVDNTMAGRVNLTARGLDGGVVIDVADTGRGIPPGRIEDVFEKFSRLTPNAGMARPGSGLGLGLAISREFARLLGGSLTARSEVGKGSVFTLFLPSRSEG
jgi:two-component system, sensor histidine kinase